LDDRMLMAKIHSKFSETGAVNEIISTIKRLEESVATLTDYIKNLEKIIDGQMKGKTRDAFIDRIKYLEKKRMQIEVKMGELRRSVN
jgi:uncharacterized protein (UPF0335 family)